MIPHGDLRRIGRDGGVDPWSLFLVQRLSCHQGTDHVGKTEEERLAQRETRRDVRPVYGEKTPQLDLAGMLLGIAVESGGIGIEQRAGIGRQARILALGRAARAQQMINVIDLRPVLARDRAIAPASHRRDILESGEIVLGMSDGDAERDVRIGSSVDVRHAEFVAHDLCTVGAPIGRCGAMACGQRLPHHQRDQHGQQQRQQAEPGQLQTFSQTLSPQSRPRSYMGGARWQVTVARRACVANRQHHIGAEFPVRGRA